MKKVNEKFRKNGTDQAVKRKQFIDRYGGACANEILDCEICRIQKKREEVKLKIIKN